MAFCIYRTSDGVLQSVESQTPDPDLHDLTGLSVVERTVPSGECVWDTTMLDFKADLSRVRTDKKAELAVERDTTILTTVATSYGTFYTDDKSKLLMAGKLLGILLAEKLGQSPPTTVSFKTTTGFQTFNTTDFMTAALQVLGGIEQVFTKQAALEAHIDALTDATAIEEVTWATDLSPQGDGGPQQAD